MNVLVDTHLLLWSLIQPERLSARARAILGKAENQLWFSAVNIAEIAIKTALRKPGFDVDPEVFAARLRQNGYLELPVSARHAAGLATLPAHHGDPFDRLLVAQAHAEGLSLLTSDRRLALYEGPVHRV